METQALVQRWPIKPEYRDALVKKLLKIALDPNSKPREVASAARALLAAEAQNINDEQYANNVLESERNRILSIVARIDAGRRPVIIESGGVRDAEVRIAREGGTEEQHEGFGR
jgi:hypothetical protein